MISGVALHIFDFGSDLLLAHEHFSNNDRGWGAITLVFVIYSWLMLFLTTANEVKDMESMFGCYLETCCQKVTWTEKSKFFYMCTVFNLIPVWYTVEFVRARRSNDERKTDSLAKRQKYSNGLVALTENFPQLCLQLYIVGYTNRITPLSLLSIFTSVVSLSAGYGKYIESVFRFKLSTLSSILLIALNLLQLIAGVVPVSFLASLKHHASRDNSAIHLYTYMHITYNGSLWARSVKHKTRWAISCNAIVNFIYFLIMSWVSTAWFVSIASFVDPSTIGVIHSHIWPKPPTMFAKWVVGANTTSAVAPNAIISSVDATTSANSTTTNATVATSPFYQ